MSESLKLILLAVLLVFFGTKNGRALMIQTVRESFYYVPISIRRVLVAHSTLIPLQLSRFLLYLATSPIGNEKKWIHQIKRDTWEGVWIQAPNIKNQEEAAENAALKKDLIILYIHGGGFSMGYSTMYMSSFQFIISQLHKQHQITSSILSIDYSLSPENVWPKACNEIIEAYRYLIHDLGISPSKVILMGDSAGGNLAASTLLALKDQRKNKNLQDLPPLPLPAGAALLSPWVDTSITPPDCFTTAANKDSLRSNMLAYFRSNYLPTNQSLLVGNPLISPIHGDFSKMCPFFVAYGEHEILKSSIGSFISKLKENGCNVTSVQGENQSHIWIMYSVMATSKEVFKKDARLLVNWMAKCS